MSDKLNKADREEEIQELRAEGEGGGRRALCDHLSIASGLTLGIDKSDSQSVNMLNNKLCEAGTQKR